MTFTANIDFRSSGTKSGNWNTATGPSLGLETADLIDNTGAATGVSLAVGGTLPSAESLGVSSVGSGDAAWVDDTLTSLTCWTYNGVVGTLVFGGLNNSDTYEIEIYSSRDATGDRTLEASTDAFSTVFAINGANNTTETLALTAISPAAGEITLSIRESSGAIAAYLNALRFKKTAAAADVTAPVLSTPTGTKTGGTTASGTIVTDEGNGTLYFYASTNATETAATIKASGSSQAVSATGSQSVNFTGLTASTTYYAHYVQDDAAANESSVANSASFTTDAVGLTIDSTDATMQRNTDFQLVCSTPSTTPTTGNTTLTNGNDTLTPSSVTGSDPYTLTFPVGDLSKQVDATGYDWTLEITPDEP